MTKKRTTKKLIDKIVEFGIDFSPLEVIANYVKTGEQPPKNKMALASFLMYARSDTEFRWRTIGIPLIENEFGQKVVFCGYEWISFKIPGGSYTPDFFMLLEDGTQVCIEIKASQMQAGYRDARSKLRASASLNPWIIFYESRLDKNGWLLEKIPPDYSMVSTILGYDKHDKQPED